MTTATASEGRFNYLAASVASSLYRNGAVLSRRDADGSDDGIEGVVLDERAMTIHDARRLAGAARRTCEHHGFELVPRPLERADLDFFHHREVAEDYYPDCARLVQETTGAAHVYAFDHNIRSASGKESQRRIEGGQQVQGPAHLVHGDYTLRSAPERLQQLAKPPGGNDTLRALLPDGASLIDPEVAGPALAGDARFAIINVWRNIAHEPVATHPLALCDGQSVVPEDLVVFEIHYRDRIGENYFAKHAPRHAWYTYPGLTRDEALLIKQWDSSGPLAASGGERADGQDLEAPCTFSFHSAFEDPATPPDAPERWSIEVRCMAVYA